MIIFFYTINSVKIVIHIAYSCVLQQFIGCIFSYLDTWMRSQEADRSNGHPKPTKCPSIIPPLLHTLCIHLYFIRFIIYFKTRINCLYPYNPTFQYQGHTPQSRAQRVAISWARIQCRIKIAHILQNQK